MVIATSKYYRLHQDTSNRSFLLDLEQKVVPLRFCELLALREKLFALEMASLFYEESCPHDFKILTFCNQQHLVLISIEQLLDLRRLLLQAFVSLGLSHTKETVHT